MHAHKHSHEHAHATEGQVVNPMALLETVGSWFSRHSAVSDVECLYGGYCQSAFVYLASDMIAVVAKKKVVNPVGPSSRYW